MIVTIAAENAPDAYVESFWTMKAYGKPEESRAGPVLSVQNPVVLEVNRPCERVITDPQRNCNPFFHVMETVWMFAGEDHVGFPARFNSTYVNYAEPDGVVHGAYGKRWRDHWKVTEANGRYSLDQIQLACAILRQDPASRQVVLSMWDPPADLGAKKNDRPCNTHIYFRARVIDWSISPKTGVALPIYTLDMTVCNRSNDLLWGMLGANIVHMTYLHELVCHGAGMNIGVYRVFTNNLHIYTEADVAKEFMKGPVRNDVYLAAEPMRLLEDDETVEQFFADCEDFVKDPLGVAYKTTWMNGVALPMYLSYMERKNGLGDGLKYAEQIDAQDWRIACQQWISRKTR